MRKLITLLVIVFLPSLASATSYFVTQAGAGSHNGLSIANAFSVANYNASSAPTGGDTVFFSGTITSEVIPNTGGTSSSVRLTLDFTSATLNVASGNESIFIGVNNIILTGGTFSSSTGTGNLFTCAASVHSFIDIDNFTYTGPSGGIVTALDGGLCSNFTLSGNHFDNVGNGPDWFRGKVTNITIQNNFIRDSTDTTQQDDVVTVADASTVLIQGNQLIQQSPGLNSGGQHNDVIQTFHSGAGSAANPSGWTVRYNLIQLAMNTPFRTGDNSWNQLESFDNSAGWGIKIYGNVYLGEGSVNSGNNGFGEDAHGITSTNFIYNNTIIRKIGPDRTIGWISSGAACSACVLNIENNIGMANSGQDSVDVDVAAFHGTWDYNFWFQFDGNVTSGSQGTHGSLSTNPQFNNYNGDDFSLASASTLKKIGDSTIGAEYNQGPCPGATWPNPTLCTRSAGAWDIGAFQSASGSATLTVTTDGSGSSHVGTAMTTALSYPNPAGCVTNTTTSNICYVGSTLTVTGSACTSAAPCTWTLADQNGDSIAASTPVGLYPSVALLDNYVSGITATGSAGQTCALSSFNNGGTGATATVALTGTNAIASGALLTITNPGSGFTLAPTAATAGNGTATCSGTATVQTVVPSPATPLGQIDCSTSTAKTVCNYNAPVDYPSTQLVTITATDGTTIATGTAAFNYPNNLNEWFTHRGRTLYACPFGNCVTLTGSAPNQIGVTINNIPWSIYSKATTPVTYQPLQVTFLNTLTGNTEASILTLTSDPTILTTGGGPLMPITSGSSINRPGMSYNGKWNLWATSTPHPGGGSTGTLTYAQQTNGSATQVLSNACKAVGYSVMVEKNQPGWLLTNDATNLNVCNLDNAQAVTNIIAHGMGTRGSGDPEGFSYEGGTADNLYPLRQINNATCGPPVTAGCAVNVATFNVSGCYASLTANCASQSGTTWNSFINPGMTYGWNEQGTIHCSAPVESPTPNCEFHYHDIWFVPRSNIIASLYGSFSQAGESIYYQQPLGGGTIDSSSCATPPAWGSGTTTTCLAPNVASNIPFWGHPAFNHAVNYLVAYSGRQFCGSTVSNQCNNNTNGNGVTDMRNGSSVFFSSTEVVGHSCWDGYNTDVFCHDGGFRNTQDIVNGCVNQALRTVTISTTTSTPYGRFGCRPEGSSGTINSYILSPSQSPDATKLLYSSAVSQQNNNTRIALGWMFQTAQPAPPVGVTLNGTSSAQIQWTAAALNRETQLYWVYKQPSCVGGWTRLASVAASNWGTNGFSPSIQSFTDASLASGQNACYGVTSQEWAGAESAALSNTIKITNTGGVFSFVSSSGPGTTFSISGPNNASTLAISQKLICATNCAAVNTPHAPTTSAGAGTFPGPTTYFAMVVYGKCVDFPNCSNFKGTLPSLASPGLSLTSQGLNVFPNNNEMVGQDAIQVYVNTAATPASAFHLQTPTSCTPTATVINSTIVLLNNFNVAASNQANCLFGTYNAAGAAPPTSNTAVGGYQLTWTDPGGPGDRYQQIYYSETGIVPANEAAAQPFLIATPPVGTQSFYDAFANQQVLPANIHYAVVTKRMDGTRSNGVCMTGAGVAETGSGASACVATSGTTATLAPNLAFGNQNINTTSSGLAITLTNTGTNPLIVTQAQLFGTNFNLTGAGTCAGTSFTLQPAPAANSCTFVITFTPTATTSYSGTFQVTDNATGSPQIVTLSGTGTAPIITWVSPQGGTTYNYGNISTGVFTDSPPLTLQNTGTGPLNVSLTINGANPTRFSIQSTTCPSVLAAGSSCTAIVRFTPIAVTSYSATLTETDSTQSLSAFMNLLGAGVTPPVQQEVPAPWVIIARRKGR